jgi:hypothetical protein
MWLAQLHAAPTRSVLSAPLNVATAVAARTKRMKIGTAVQVLPLCHSLRVVEEAATDQISHGRLICCWAQWVSANIRGLRYPLCGKPGTFRRNVGNHQAGLD